MHFARRRTQASDAALNGSSLAEKRRAEAVHAAFSQGFSGLVIFETGRDGTVLTRFVGKEMTGNGRDGKIGNFEVGWMGLDGKVRVKFLDGTGR